MRYFFAEQKEIVYWLTYGGPGRKQGGLKPFGELLIFHRENLLGLDKRLTKSTFKADTYTARGSLPIGTSEGGILLKRRSQRCQGNHRR